MSTPATEVETGLAGAPAPEHAPVDIRPLVGGPVSRRAPWLFGVGLVVAGIVLFSTLESHRSAILEPAIGTSAEDTGNVIASAPELAVPPAYEPVPGRLPAGYGPQLVAPAAMAPVADLQPGRRLASPASQATQPIAILPAGGQDNRRRFVAPVSTPAPQVIYDAALARPAPTGEAADAGKGDNRVVAARFANPATTVPKGTVVQAVLETALDSTRAGFARAIVSRDIHGFDGTRILIPKGSRLIGEYKADLATGQSRALIQWQRLMLPDGIYINLDSPSADPLGRAGIKGRVNNHFLAKFGGAILQTVLDIGVQVASNRIASGNGTTIYAPGLYALPGTVQGNSAVTGTQKVQPTLTVRQGTSVSVFVARDLDFTAVSP